MHTNIPNPQEQLNATIRLCMTYLQSLWFLSREGPNSLQTDKCDQSLSYTNN